MKSAAPAPMPYRATWFEQGLRFACQQCGICCTGDPGIVFATAEEAAAMARLMGKEVEELVGSSLLPEGRGYRLREEADGSCVFYADGCQVYGARPVQCRTYPFWISVVRSPERWRQESRLCPGIGQGPLFTEADILSRLGDDPPTEEPNTPPCRAPVAQAVPPSQPSPKRTR